MSNFRRCTQNRLWHAALALPQPMMFSFPFVLFPGGQAAPDVSLGLVDLQHHLHLLIQGPVEGGQPLGQVLVYRGFAQAEFLGGTAHRALLFDDLQCTLAGSLFHVPFQTATLPHGSHASIYM